MCHLTGKSEPVAPSEDECKAVVGEPAPDFELESDLGGKVKLSDLKGKKVVLYFYPKDNTSGCTMQAVNFQATLDKFEKAGYVVIGVSRDSLKSHTNFRNKQGLKFPLLCSKDEVDVRQKIPRHCPQYICYRRKRHFGGRIQGCKGQNQRC